MKAGARKATVTDEHREESRKLKEIWMREKRPTQAVFGETFGIGGQSAVNNFLNGGSALSMRAAKGFARGLGCEISDFSPRLAREAAELGALVSTAPTGGQSPAVQPAVSQSRALDVQSLQLLGYALEAADPESRVSAAVMLKAFIDNPSANEDVLPLIVRRLSGELSAPPIAAAGGAK